jgi:hypothetical protein
LRLFCPAAFERRNFMFGTILIVVVILMLVGALPRWNHSREWGYFPSGGLGLVLLIVVILILLGRL